MQSPNPQGKQLQITWQAGFDNGAEPVASPDGTLPDLPPRQLSREGSVLVPPRSIAFVRLALRVDDD